MTPLPFMTIPQAAKKLDLHPESVRRLAEEMGLLKSRMGNAWVITEADVNAIRGRSKSSPSEEADRISLAAAAKKFGLTGSEFEVLCNELCITAKLVKGKLFYTSEQLRLVEASPQLAAAQRNHRPVRESKPSPSPTKRRIVPDDAYTQDNNVSNAVYLRIHTPMKVLDISKALGR